MRHRRSNSILQLVVVASLLLTTAAAAQFPANQPFASFWFPNELLAWSPETDPDAPYNRGSVPLARRFAGPETQANPHARADEGLIVNLAVMYPTTSNNPSQGAPVFDVYAFNYWQYVDGLVFWGGSAGEGLILAPNPGVIDAAHRHGVPVLGNIFFPPNVFGGNIQWVRDLVQRDGDRFPVADKLIEVASYYGFDGWFINQETSGGDSALADEIQEFMRAIQRDSDLLVMWYDSMIESGPILYQNELNTLNDEFFDDGGATGGGIFLNYNWSTQDLIDSVEAAEGFDRSPYGVLAGVNVGSNGYDTFVNWSALFPEDAAHRLSLGFFGNHWTFNSALDNADFYARMKRFWSGQNGDPSDTDTPFTWKGLAHYVPAKSSIDRLPFVSHFNTGQGHLFAVDGEVLAGTDWNNLSLQDVLPTWRWIVRTAGTPLAAELDWTTAYYGGTSLRLSGLLDAPNTLGLFKTRLELEPTTRLEIAFRTGEIGDSHLQAGLLFDGPTRRFEFLDLGPTTDDGWNLRRLDLSPYAGRRLILIALRAAATEPITDYGAHVGRVALVDADAAAPRPPAGALVEDKLELDPQTAAVRLRWLESPDPTYVYNVYRRNADGSRTHLGSSPSTAAFLAAVPREGSEPTTTLEVEAASLEMRHSSPATTMFEWDSP